MLFSFLYIVRHNLNILCCCCVCVTFNFQKKKGLYINFSYAYDMSYHILHTVKMTAFLGTALCSLIEIDRHFTGAYCLHHQGDMIMEAE
jgi:hypothetical protein